jgi:hypothetical protein
MLVHFSICLLTHHNGISHPKGTTVTLTATFCIKLYSIRSSQYNVTVHITIDMQHNLQCPFTCLSVRHAVYDK